MHITHVHHSTLIQSTHKPYLTTQKPLFHRTSHYSALHSLKMSISYTQTDVLCFLLYNVIPVCVQDFPLLWLDDIVDEQSNIVGFSMFNTTHPFYLEFIRSLNLSWREGCDINPYPGPAVRHTQTQYRSLSMYHTQTAHTKLCMCVFSCRRPCCLMRSMWW